MPTWPAIPLRGAAGEKPSPTGKADSLNETLSLIDLPLSSGRDFCHSKTAASEYSIWLRPLRAAEAVAMWKQAESGHPPVAIAVATRSHRLWDSRSLFPGVWKRRCFGSEVMTIDGALDAPMNLYQARNHAYLKLLEISNDWTTRRALNQIGLYAGDRVRVLRRAPFGGPLVVRSHNSQVAISKQLAEKIRVEVIH